MIGTINLSVDDDNNPLGYEDYKDPEYSIEAYLKAYDPKKWGKKEPTGKLEEARLRSKDNQKERVLIRVGSNTTIIGLGDDAKIVGGGLYVKKRGKRHYPQYRIRKRVRFLPWLGSDGWEQR